MPRAERVEVIRQIEANRGSKLFTYICNDRPGLSANIGEDAVRPMFDHVRRIGKVPKLDLYLYSRGGAVEVPGRIVSMLREYAEELVVLIPYRAQSAATLIVLGCDAIVMGSKAELGPSDPALSRITPQEGGTAVQEEEPWAIGALASCAGHGAGARPWAGGALGLRRPHVRSRIHWG
jgi:hypothetical protein